MRTSELTRLKFTDIETDRPSGVRFLRIPQGKRNKERRVILPDACYQALRHYWRQYRPETPENWMFPARKTTGCLKSNVFTHEFKTCLKYGRLSEEFHSHSLRHSFSCHHIQNDPNSILRLKHLLGHASLASTEVYIDVSMVDTTNLDPLKNAEIQQSFVLTFFDQNLKQEPGDLQAWFKTHSAVSEVTEFK